MSIICSENDPLLALAILCVDEGRLINLGWAADGEHKRCEDGRDRLRRSLKRKKEKTGIFSIFLPYLRLFPTTPLPFGQTRRGGELAICPMICLLTALAPVPVQSQPSRAPDPDQAARWCSHREMGPHHELTKRNMLP